MIREKCSQALHILDRPRHLVFFQAATDLTIFPIALSIVLGIGNHGKEAARSTLTAKALGAPTYVCAIHILNPIPVTAGFARISPGTKKPGRL